MKQIEIFTALKAANIFGIFQQIKFIFSSGVITMVLKKVKSVYYSRFDLKHGGFCTNCKKNDWKLAPAEILVKELL